jgi:acid phosphatase type 7
LLFFRVPSVRSFCSMLGSANKAGRRRGVLLFLAGLGVVTLCFVFGAHFYRGGEGEDGDGLSRKLRRVDADGPYVGYYETNRRFSTTRRTLAESYDTDKNGMQIHIAYGVPATSSVVVSWANGDSKGPAPASTVKYSESLKDIQNGKGSSAGVTCEKPAFYEYTSAFKDPPFRPASVGYKSPFMHHCTIKGLKTSTKYFYQVGPYPSGKTPPSTAYSFHTARPVGDGSRPMEVAIAGDLGQTTFSEATRDAIMDTFQNKGNNLEFGFIVGDMSYADGQNTRWDSFGNKMESLMARFPMHVMVGNHEIELDKKTNDTFVPYRFRYRMPGTLKEVTAPMKIFPTFEDKYTNFDLTYEGGSSYYSFSAGLAHFVVINSYDTHDTKKGSPQYTFVENDLKGLDRKVTPWVFVLMHCPFYQSNRIHQDEHNTELTKAWAEGLFLKYGVDMVFAGHVHAYQRTTQVPMGTGPVYITVGDGGNHEELYNKFEPTSWNAYHDGSHYGSGKIRVLSSTEAEWVWRANPDPVRKGAQDSVKLLKNPKTGKNKISNPYGALYFTVFFILTFSMVMMITWNNAKKKMFGTDIKVPWHRVQGEDESETVGQNGDDFIPPSVVLSTAPVVQTVSSIAGQSADVEVTEL